MPKERNQNQGRTPYRREAQEFEQRVLDIARVARVVAGGRRFSFRTTVAIGDQKGRVGVGVGKGSDVSISMGKATRNAKKNIMYAPITPEGTLPYETTGKQTGSKVFLKPAPAGTGIIAGGPVRVICNLAGYKDVVAKILSRSTNKLNIAMATVNALEAIEYTLPKPKDAKVKDKAKTPDSSDAVKKQKKEPKKAKS
ncbi:MAG: 30S ribosomal protein S5 [Candidatus Spechtbacteria bacterium]|nr:30S ribosomal protein S5 [Candidatus Spechtbacteria bacterium]